MSPDSNSSPRGSASRAVVYDRYGSPDVLDLVAEAAPVPTANQVMVRVHAASLNPLDWHSMRGTPYVGRLAMGWKRPKRGTLGADLAGVVESVGSNVSQFEPGDEVYGNSTRTLADHVVVAADGLALKPTNLSFEQAAAVGVAGITALQGLRNKGGIRAGHRVLINGASGGVGTFAVQISKSFGAEVTGVCSARNEEMVRSIGATHVIDYTHEDFTGTGQRYDLILDAVGSRSLTDLRRALTRDGTLVMIGPGRGKVLGPLLPILQAAVISRLFTQRMLWFLSEVSQQDLLTLKDLIESGTVTPVIDRTYPLDRTAEAIAYLEEGHASGKVVITVRSD